METPGADRSGVGPLPKSRGRRMWPISWSWKKSVGCEGSSIGERPRCVLARIESKSRLQAVEIARRAP
jgi:hypothetical protein